MYRLVFLSGRYQGKRLVVRQAVTLVGRDATCHLCLSDDDQLAPRHARFEERGTGVYLSSLAAGNRLERNGQAVAEAVRLAHNDLLVLGQTQIQFQDIIAPQPRLRPSIGLIQPATWLIIVMLLVLELGLLAFLVNWPRYIIRPDAEAIDQVQAKRARVRQIRMARNTRKPTQTNAPPPTTKDDVVIRPGTTLAAPAGGAPQTPPAASSPETPPRELLLEAADFAPADTNVPLVELPPVSAADPLIAEAEQMLAQAREAAQFADRAKAESILSQIHRNVPDFLPAHVEYARLLEARGKLDDARQRWAQIVGIAPEGSPFHAQALQERERLARIQTLQTRKLQSPGTFDLDTLPRQIRIASSALQKMPPDSNVEEMRVLNAALNLAPDARLFKNAIIQVFITFYDIGPDGQPRPTQAKTTDSPQTLGPAFADRRSVQLEASYVVPRGQRNRERNAAGQPYEYYGYTIHVFAGQILQDAIAKPNKLLALPVHFPESSPGL